MVAFGGNPATSLEVTMRTSLVRRQNPLSLMNDPFDVFSTLFHDPFSDREDGLSLRSRVEDTGSDYTFTIEVPGFTEEEINIEVRDRNLEIVAEHKEKSDGKYFHQSVHRAWSLPRGVNEDSINATLKNGILSIAVPKKEIPEPKKIQVKALSE